MNRFHLFLCTIGLLLVSAASTAFACTSVDGKPDPVCTPGVADPRVTQANIHQTICVPGYTRSVRPPVAYTNALKRRQMIEYALPGTTKDYQEDHLLALELGGAPSDPRNLWPAAWAGSNNVREKDRISGVLHRLVCRGAMPLAEAQRRMLTDWRLALP